MANPMSADSQSVYSTVSEETASGDDTRPEDFTAAHRSLPFGTLIHVNNQENGRTVVVRITDRGPFVSGRIVDLSQIAARELDISGLMLASEFDGAHRPHNHAAIPDIHSMAP